MAAPDQRRGRGPKIEELEELKGRHRLTIHMVRVSLQGQGKWPLRRDWRSELCTTPALEVQSGCQRKGNGHSQSLQS